MAVSKEEYIVFLQAAEDLLTCADCKHCQKNKQVPNRAIDWHCYHHENIQTTLHQPQAMQVSADFLCCMFEIVQRTTVEPTSSDERY